MPERKAVTEYTERLALPNSRDTADGEESPAHQDGFDALPSCPVSSSYPFICKAFSIWRTEQD